MDSAAKMKALSLQLIILLAVARHSICNALTPAPVPSSVKTLSADNATDFSCLNRTFDMYFPNVESGCRKFHLCTKTEGDEVLNLSFMCPEGTSFDFRSADCQSAETVTCRPENGGIRAVRKVSKQLKNKLQLAQPKTSFKCRGKKLGSYYADLETNCTTFHLCTMGEFKSEILDFQFMCLEGTLFDEQWLQCRPEGVTACGKIPPKTPLLEKPQQEVQKPLLQTQPLLEPALPGSPDLSAKQLEAEVLVATLPEPLQPTEPARTEATSTTSADYAFDVNGTEVDYDYYEDALSLPVRERRSAALAIGRIMSVRSERVRAKRAPPNLDSSSLPVTSFSCTGKVPGGYYADVETGCQMYHVCAPGADGAMRSTKFLCGNNTVFSQQTRTCQIWYTVDCDSTPHFFTLNEELSRVQPEDTFASQAALEQQTSLDQSSQQFDQSPRQFQQSSRQSDQSPQQFQQPSQQPPSDAFEAFQFQQPFRTSRPEVALQPPVDHFQQLAEVQRAEDAARATTSRPSRKRKQKRRRKQRPRPQPQPDVPEPLQQDLFGFGFQSPFLQEPVTQRPSPRVPSFSSDRQPQPQVFNIPEHVPGLLEEIQVRGRFQQTEEDLIREQLQAQPRNPAQRARLQPQESVEVRVPTAQRVADPAPAPAGGSVFQGFDAFIQAAIEQEHEQRARLGPALEQRRREEAEAERQRETTRKRKRPRTTTARPQPDLEPESAARFPAFPTRQQRPVQVQDQSPREVIRIQDQGPREGIRIQDQDPRTVIQAAPRPQQRVAPQPQPASNFNGFVFQQFAQQPQRISGLGDIVFLVPSESELLPSAVAQPVGVTGQSHFLDTIPQSGQASPQQAPQEQFPPTNFQHFVQTAHQQQQQQPPAPDFPSLVAQSPAPAQGQSQLIRFDSANSSGFEIRTRFRRQAPQDEALPSTPFSCKSKVLGGYYADTYTACNMFHICTSGRKKGLLYDFRFWCANGTAFDQRSQTCADPKKVNCQLSAKYYPTHPPPKELDPAVPHPELMKIRVKRAVRNVLAPGPKAPVTSFRCAGRDANRYYADADTNCQMFHLCAENGPGGRLADYPFFCRNGTVFDERSQACDDQTDALNCQDDPTHYGIGEIFGRI